MGEIWFYVKWGDFQIVLDNNMLLVAATKLLNIVIFDLDFQKQLLREKFICECDVPHKKNWSEEIST